VLESKSGTYLVSKVIEYLEHQVTSIRKEAFECMYAILVEANCSIVKWLIEAGVMKSTVEQLKSAKNVAATISNLIFSFLVAAKVSYWILYAGIHEEDRSQDVDSFQNLGYTNSLALQFQDIGGLDAIEDLIIHSNGELREIANHTIQKFYGYENDEQPCQNNDEHINDGLGKVEYEFEDVKEKEYSLF